MLSNTKPLIAVIGATGRQGGAVVSALKASSQFKVRALTPYPGKHRELADEVVEADLNRPETLRAAFEGAHGVFLVTNFWEEGTDEGNIRIFLQTTGCPMTYTRFTLDNSTHSLWRATFNNPPINLIDSVMIGRRLGVINVVSPARLGGVGLA